MKELIRPYAQLTTCDFPAMLILQVPGKKACLQVLSGFEKVPYLKSTQ